MILIVMVKCVALRWVTTTLVYDKRQRSIVIIIVTSLRNVLDHY